MIEEVKLVISFDLLILDKLPKSAYLVHLMKISSPHSNFGPNRILAIAYVLIVMALFASGEPFHHFETEFSDITTVNNHKEPFSQDILAPAHSLKDLLDLHQNPWRLSDGNSQWFRLIAHQTDHASMQRLRLCQTTFLSIRPSLQRRLLAPPKKGMDPPPLPA